MKTFSRLLALASIGHLIGYGFAVPEHIVDAAWPAHARFHVFQALLWLAAVDLVAAGIALGPFARGDRWARWALLAVLLLVHVGYFVALAFFPDGHPAPGMAAHVPLGAALVLFVVALALGWRGGGGK